MTGWCMWCVPFAVGGITRVPTGGRVVCRFIDAFLTCCRVDGGRRRPGGRLLVRRCGTAGRPTRRTVPAPHESGLFAPRRRRKTQKKENRFRWAMRREWGGVSCSLTIQSRELCVLSLNSGINYVMPTAIRARSIARWTIIGHFRVS